MGKAGSIVNFKLLGIRDGDVLQPQLSQRVECHIGVCTSTLYEALEIKPAPHRLVEISGFAVDLAMERLSWVHRHTELGEVLGED
jgi:hypothetical protein